MPQHAFCTLAQVRKALAEPFGSVDPGPEVISRACVEAYELAHAAYEVGDPASTWQAERILHAIHVSSAFGPPMQPLPSALWSVLLRARVAAALRAAPSERVESAADLATRMDAAVKELGAFNHSIFDDIARDTTNRSLVVYTKNWFGSTHGFTYQLTSLVQRSEGPIKLSVLKNLSDEFDGVPHDDLRARFIERINLRYEPEKAVDDVDRVTESFGLSSYRTGVTLLPDPAFALGSFYAIEANFPFECNRMLELLRARGFEEQYLEIFSLHVGADEDHAAEWLEVLRDNMPAEKYGLAVAGAIAQLRARRSMFDAMQAYLRSERPTAQ